MARLQSSSRLLLVASLVAVAAPLVGQTPETGTIGGRITLTTRARGRPLASATYPTRTVTPHDAPTGPEIRNVIVHLTGVTLRSALPATRVVMRQEHETFIPHVLAVTKGSTVEFPNADPFFHNVFSLHDGVRFDLGLYEHGNSKIVRFSKPGASFIFCNIHPEMSAVIMVMNSPYYAATDAKGAFSIADVPSGEYQLPIWHERAMENQLKSLSRRLTVGISPVSVESLKIDQTAGAAEHHKNKFGMDYEAQPPYKTP